MRDGIICIDKPAEHTSFDVIARVRGILHMKKVGHAGTLDPMTTGVLPVFLGRATKACDILPVQDKRMEALIQKKDLERGACSGIAVADRARVVEQALENHGTYILSFGYEIRTLSIIAAFHQKFKHYVEFREKSGIM